MQVATVYEFPVPTNPSTTPDAIARMAYTIALNFYGDTHFDLEVSVRGMKGSWQAQAIATRNIEVNGAHPQ